MPRGRTIAFGLISVCAGIFLFLVAAEIALRILPTNEGLRVQPVTAEDPILHFQPNRTSTWSRDWNFPVVNQVRVNNFGFVNDRDYEPAGTGPLLAVIGDSYVEAAMVPFPDTIQGRLATALDGRGRVYSFAASGAGFGQYLAWARYARDTFRPGAMVFVVIANDFKEALHKYERSSGFHYFADAAGDGDGGADGNGGNDGLELIRVDYRPSLPRRVLRRSALAMYLITNLKVHARLDLALQFGADDTRYIGNVAAEVPAEVLADGERATAAFLDRLPAFAGLPPERILLLLDGIRPDLYDAERLAAATDTYWDRMRRHVIAAASARGIAVADLQPRFIGDYARHRRRFEFATDSHWSGEGHRVAAEAVMAWPAVDEVFGAGN